MAETPEIKITIDQDALREEVSQVLYGVLNDAAQRLRSAADQLDGGAWWRDQADFVEERVAQKVRNALEHQTMEETDGRI